jgi:putative inorganic carbon (HCO3(-)) transporter
MLAPALPRPPLLRAPQGWPLLWAGAALLAGLLVAALPLEHGLALLAGAALAAVAVLDPLAGLALAMILGPARAYLATALPGVPSDLGQVFFALAAAGWLARGLARRSLVVPRSSLLVPLGLYLGVGLLSLLPAASLEEGLKELIKWAQVGVVIVILAGEAARGRARAIVAAVLLAGLAQALLGLWQYQFRGLGPEHFQVAGGQFRAYGTFEQPNPFGGFLGLLWPVAAALAWSWLARFWQGRQPRALGAALGLGLLAGVLGAGLLASFSRGAWLGAAAAAVALAVRLPRRALLGLALVAVSGLAGWGLLRAGLVPAGIAARLDSFDDLALVADVRGITITEANFAVIERLAHWQAASDMARDHPWLGVGLGNYGVAYAHYGLLNWPNALGHAHLIYLNVLAETGLLGLATYLLLWAAVFAATLRVIARAAGTTRGLALGLFGAWTHLSVHHLVDNLYVNNIHLMLGALLALLVWLQQKTGR